MYFETGFCWKTIQEYINDMTYVSRSFNLLADKYRDAGNKEKEDEYGEYYIEYSSSELEKMLGEASYLLGGIFTDFEDKETLSNIELFAGIKNLLTTDTILQMK